MADKTENLAFHSDPFGSQLQVNIDGEFLAIDEEAARKRLRKAFKDGHLDELAFRAVVFLHEYPNANFVRFRDADIGSLAASFVGHPFLRDHNQREIEARAGTVHSSGMDENGVDMVQDIRITVPRDIEAFINGQMDRFSIGWHSKGFTCSVCDQDWLSNDCQHWPGRSYKLKKDDGEIEKLCEIYCEAPNAVEVSAVNAPAVAGTGVRTVLEQLSTMKQDPANAANRMDHSRPASEMAHTENDIEAGADDAESKPTPIKTEVTMADELIQATEQPQPEAQAQPSPAAIKTEAEKEIVLGVGEEQLAKFKEQVREEFKAEIDREYQLLEESKGKMFRELLATVREERELTEFASKVTSEGVNALPVKAEDLATLLKDMPPKYRDPVVALLREIHKSGTVDFSERGTQAAGGPKTLSDYMQQALDRWVEQGNDVAVFFKANELGNPAEYKLDREVTHG